MTTDLQDVTPDISDEELKESEPYLKTVASIQQNISDCYAAGVCLTKTDAWKVVKDEILKAHGQHYRTAYLMHRAILLAFDELLPTEKE